LKQIVAVFSDAQAADRGTAAETLGKLKYAARSALVLSLAEPNQGELAVSTRWILDNKPSDERVGAAYLLLRIGRPRDNSDWNH
jgi:hypothetical protein